MKMKSLADDTSLYVEFDNANSASEALNDYLINIQQWVVDFSNDVEEDYY